MKKASIIIALFIVSILLLVFLRHKVRPPEVAESSVQKRSEHSARDLPSHVAVLDMTGHERKSNAKVFKPKSLRIEEGAATVLEIDHGLPEQLVDTKEMRKGVDHGLLGAITLRVVDSTGNVVQGATVKGAFWRPGAIKDRRFNIETDGHGEVYLENKSAGDLNFSITKDGYYDSTFRYWFFKNGYDCAKDGRWIPWNPTVEIVLKEKRNPIEMERRTVDLKVPLKNRDYGFDSLSGDWVEPDGIGKTADIWIKCWGSNGYVLSQNYTNELLFTSASADGGFMRKPKDTWSGLPSEYEAPEAGYSETFHLAIKRTETEIFERLELSESDYVIFKIVRDPVDENGRRTWYGKIYGPLIYGIMTDDREGGGVKFDYYLNPTPGDHNLEAKGRSP